MEWEYRGENFQFCWVFLWDSRAEEGIVISDSKKILSLLVDDGGFFSGCFIGDVPVAVSAMNM